MLESRTRRRDDGTVLPLVLVLMVVAGLIVIPLLGYAVAVLRSNTVVSQRTAAVEAAKGGVRMALGDPVDVFLTCDSGGDLTAPDSEINDIAVTVTCSELEEVGPLQALGFQVPIGVVANQLGANIPAEFSGDRAQSGPVPPYPVSPAGPDWWLGQETAAASTGKIWTPDLPRLPGTVRTNVPFDMPAAFGCKVYFPGRYNQPLSITGTVYFASGVYYFDEPVTVSGNADVVVGYGLEELPNPDCSDDIQVASNVVGNPGTFDINGGGATWVFGDNGRLVVDDTATTTSLRVRFNQRYADADRGGRVSIMTVNGGTSAGSAHVVTNVNKVPRSVLLNGTNRLPIDGTGYVPSSPTFSGTGLTDKARVPAAPTGFTATAWQYNDAGTPRGAVLMTWNEVTGQAAGGALIDRYDVTITPTPGSPTNPARCSQPADFVVTGAPGARKVSCLATRLSLTTTSPGYSVSVRAVNEVGSGPSSTTLTARPRLTSPISPILTAPAAPTNVTAVDSNIDDVAQVRWDAPASDAPITKYTATAQRVFLQPQADQVPVGGHMNIRMLANKTVVTGVPAFDPNGDALSFLTVNSTALPAAVGTVTVAGLNVTITTTATAVPGVYLLPYTVNDPYGQQTGGTITLTVIAPTNPNLVPIARAMTVAADVGVPNVNRVPAFDQNGDALTLTLGASVPPLDPTKWTVTPTGLDVSITTTAPDGTYVIPYTVRDPGGLTASSTITVTVVRGYENVGTCEVLNTPHTPLTNTCEISVPDLVPGDATSGNVGYRFDVQAVNAAGTSVAGSNPQPLPLAFNGAGAALPAPATRIVEPWKPLPIIEMVTDNGRVDVTVAIAGYVAVPMGRLAISNPDRDGLSLKGGVLAGTFDVVDARAVVGVADSLPIGFKNDIVLQRKVKIVATARNITAIAIVQVNEDGVGYRVNSWVIQ
jgi:hypothetical protein